MVEATLKPCPFCGKLPVTRVMTSEGISTNEVIFAVYCGYCHIKKTAAISDCETFEEALKAIDRAIKRWNSRV